MYCMIRKALKSDDVKCPYQNDKCGFCQFLSKFVFQYDVCCYLVKEVKDAVSQSP